MATTIPGKSPARLPGLEEFPQADLVIYDGQCRFCLASVKWLNWFAGRGKLAFLSLHDSEVAARFPDLSHEQLLQEMIVVDRQQRRHAGAASIRYLALKLPWLWWLAPLVWFPCSGPFWKWIYRQIATRRYLLFGKIDCDEGTCHIHFKR